ncbi:MAG: response regulator [Candidatus Cloacimonetes bacterium]|nr:response regulator [Candidatus Cloacimonadota bacterium]
MKSDSKKRILLVEDDSFVAMMGMRTLTINNFDVVHVNSGEKAIELIDSDPYFDMVLMDIDLGIGMEGTDAAKIILERHDVPLVFLSSHTEPEIVKKTEDITSFGYIVKDSGETVLIASIKMAFKLFDSIKKERQLKESDYNYKQLFSNMMSAFAIHELVYDKNGEAVDYRFVEVNPFFEEITGLVAKEIIGKTVLEVLPNT